MGELGADAEARAKAWWDGRLRRVCDVAEPWAHGTVFRSWSHPDYWDLNVVRVEGEPGATVAELVAVADEALADRGHRRIDFDDAEAGEARRAEFAALGWRTFRMVVMRHEAAPPGTPDVDVGVDEVDYDVVADLRRAWHREDFPDQDPGGYFEQSRAVAIAQGARVLTVHRNGRPVSFAQLEQVAGTAEITHVYVDPEYRGGGLGTAMTRAAIDAAGGVSDLWIAADDEDRPKELYRRLGFRPAWATVEMTRLP